MTPENKAQAEAINWDLTTWDGARREQMRRWAALPLERIILALEEMQELSQRLPIAGAQSGPTQKLR